MSDAGQETADEALRFLFAAAPRPRVTRVSPWRPRRPLSRPLSARFPSRTERALLRAYWALALGAAALLLAAPRWPEAGAGLGLGVPAALAVVLVPIALLARLRGGAFELACRILR